MFQRMHRMTSEVTVYVDGAALVAEAGNSLAAAMLAASAEPFRASAVSGAPRSPYCMIGNCFECLVEVDGVANCQACMITVREGMRVRRQRGGSAAGTHPG